MEVILTLKIRDAALRFLDLGFSVIPIRPGPEKKPYMAWTQYQKRRPTEEEIFLWWQTWPTANVAIITGSISGIFVVDGDGEIGNRWITEHLPKTSVYAKTGRDEGGCHCYYRIPPGEKIQNKVDWKPKVDIRGEGGYVIAPPSIHYSGRVYSFVFREGMRGWEELREFNPFKSQGCGNLQINLSQVPFPGEEPPAMKGSRNDTYARLLGRWFADGVTAEEAWDRAATWNATNQPPLGDRELKATFRSILKLHQAANPLILAPIIPVPAKEQGSEPDPTDRALSCIVTDPYPVACLQPGGLLQEIMDYVEISSANHKPIFALAAAISLVGTVLGQRVMTETGLRTNIYAVSIGYSGCGKNASHSAISAILRGSEARSAIGPTDTASGAAILKWLATDNRQVTLITLDELGLLLKGMKNPSSPMCELPRLLTKIFSEADRPYTKSYADAKFNITLPWHCLGMYASSTPMAFWGSLTEADAISGFLARLLVFEARDEAAKPRATINATVPEALTKKIDALWKIPTPIDPTRGDIARVPIPHTIPRSPEGQAIFLQWSDRYWELRNKNREDEAASAIYGRAAEHAAKLALIHAASIQGPELKTVGAESVLWATLTTDACLNTLLRGVRENVAKNAFHAEQQKILRLLVSLGGAAPIRLVFRKLHLPGRQGNELLQSLLLSGEIRQEERGKGEKGGRPSPWIVLVLV